MGTKEGVLMSLDELIEKSLKLVPQQYIDYALETKDEKLFKETIEKYGLSIDNR